MWGRSVHLLLLDIPTSGCEAWNFWGHFVNTGGVDWRQRVGADTESLVRLANNEICQISPQFVTGDHRFPYFNASRIRIFTDWHGLNGSSAKLSLRGQPTLGSYLEPTGEDSQWQTHMGFGSIPFFAGCQGSSPFASWWPETALSPFLYSLFNMAAHVSACFLKVIQRVSSQDELI